MLQKRQIGGLVAAAFAGGLGAGCQSADRGGAAAREDAAPTADPVATELRSSVGPYGDRGGAVVGSPRSTANYSQHTHASIGRDFDPDVSTDGELLVFASTSHSQRPDIYLKAVDGFAVTQITSDPSDDIQPRFSPDGERIAFCSNRAGSWDIWIVSRDGTGLTQVTSDRGDEIAPCWSPDGSQIAFSQFGTRSQQWEIWTVAVERPGTRRFLCHGLFPSWSPNGQRLAYQKARERGSRWFSVWAVDLINGEARHPTELAWAQDAACIAPRWSPSGRTLAFSAVPLHLAGRGDASAADLWTVDTHSGVRQKLTDGTLTAFNPVWGGDGRLCFVSADEGVETVWSAAVGQGGDFAAGLGASKRLTQAEVNAPAEADTSGESAE